MISIDSCRAPFAGMFGWCRDSMIKSYFEGRIGTGLAGEETAPRWAAVRSGDFLFCAGEPSKIDGLTGFIRESIGGDALIIPQDADSWQTALADCGLETGRITRYHTRLPEGGLDAGALTHITESACGCLRLVRAGEAEYSLLRDCDWENSFVSQFAGQEDFLQNGFAFCLYAGEELASAASTFGYYSGGYELQIATAPKFRRRGYAAVTGAAFLLECLRRGKRPHWDAAHMGSVRLACRLGFLPDGEYTALSLREGKK